MKEHEIIRTRKATKEAVECELLAILNRWRRRYPAYLIKGSHCDLKWNRLSLMHDDIGFLLRLVDKALKNHDR